MTKSSKHLWAVVTLQILVQLANKKVHHVQLILAHTLLVNILDVFISVDSQFIGALG